MRRPPARGAGTEGARIGSRVRRRRFPPLPEPPRWLREVPLAHRGLHGEDRAENTVAAFRAAAEAGVGVELDVHRSRDGVPVVIHDPDLARVTGRHGRIDDVDAEDLAALRVGGTDHGVPTLAAALQVLTDVPVMVEVKNVRATATLLEPAVAAVLADHPGPVCVASFNPRTLTWFRRQVPDLPRVQTAGAFDHPDMPEAVGWSLRTLRWLRPVQPCAVAYELELVDDPVVQAYRRSGGTVVAWTATDAEGLARARRWADNVVFEHLEPAEVRG